MNGPEMNYMFFQANEMINYYKKKFIYKHYYILKKQTVFNNIVDLLDDETLLELKFTCRKFRDKIENDKDLTHRSNKAELKKVREKLREYRNSDIYFIGARLENRKNRLKRKGLYLNNKNNLKINKSPFSFIKGHCMNHFYSKEFLKKKFCDMLTKSLPSPEEPKTKKTIDLPLLKLPKASVENNRIVFKSEDNIHLRNELFELSPVYLENLNCLKIVMLDDYHYKRVGEKFKEILYEDLKKLERQKLEKEKDENLYKKLNKPRKFQKLHDIKKKLNDCWDTADYYIYHLTNNIIKHHVKSCRDSEK